MDTYFLEEVRIAKAKGALAEMGLLFVSAVCLDLKKTICVF
jgi:hypothetical protein